MKTATSCCAATSSRSARRCRPARTFGNRHLITDGQADTTYNDPSLYNQQFTGKERDGESELDYFGARYHAAVLGRFTSPDAPFADQFPENPQSWNLYVYGRNNPLSAPRFRWQYRSA